MRSNPWLEEFPRITGQDVRGTVAESDAERLRLTTFVNEPIAMLEEGKRAYARLREDPKLCAEELEVPKT